MLDNSRKKNIIVMLQARVSSTRLPAKVLLPVLGRPMILRQIERIQQCQTVSKIIVVTSNSHSDDPIGELCLAQNILCFRGSLNDVLNRFSCAAEVYSPDIIVRLTGDCPLIDPSLVDKIVNTFLESKLDYLSNCDPATFPDGLDVEVFTYDVLKEANIKATLQSHREHVTPYIRNNKDIFSVGNYTSKIDLSHYRWTVDEVEDYELIKKIYEYLYASNHLFTTEDVLLLFEKHAELFSINSMHGRNDGLSLGTGQKLYRRAKKVIPGGNMLLSKRPEMFLPNQWPSYFKKSKGCKLWDLDGKEYIDMSIMGIGTNTLGYGHPEVDEAVMKTVKDGNMSTLNCPEEVYLAEKLVELHPWADMVRFARSGGEINSIAVRIARAAIGRDKIAICGYNCWHDWYLSTNLNSDKNLDGHLLPGLQPNGVPRGLMGTTLPFNYNDIEQLEQLIKDNYGEIAAIKMEVSRNEGPEENYLQKVRDVATENKIILIFDECTSGFRETFGGLHKKYKVEPDVAIFAKALGNGYAISACIGKQEFMQAAQKTFISSTFWTERIGPTAALKTLEVMEREKSWEKITRIGGNISNQWKALAEKHDLSISTWGLPALSGYNFDSSDALKYKTFVTQEMLKRGYLAANSVYACIDHTQEIVNGYFAELDPIFETIKSCEEGQDINSLLEGPICHSGFSRLN